MLKGDYRQKLAALQKRRAVTPARRAISGGAGACAHFSSPPPLDASGVCAAYSLGLILFSSPVTAR